MKAINTNPDRFAVTALPPLAQALVIRDLRGPERVSGAELMTIRRAVLAGTHDTHEVAQTAKAERARLMAIGVRDMPPATADVWLLVETISQRLGAAGHGEAWATIGIYGSRGRDLLGRSASSVNWPIWFTLRHVALGA